MNLIEIQSWHGACSGWSVVRICANAVLEEMEVKTRVKLQVMIIAAAALAFVGFAIAIGAQHTAS